MQVGDADISVGGKFFSLTIKKVNKTVLDNNGFFQSVASTQVANSSNSSVNLNISTAESFEKYNQLVVKTVVTGAALSSATLFTSDLHLITS